MASEEKEWQRGELVIRGNQIGFVKAGMSSEEEYLTVHWQSGAESIHRSRLGEIRRPTAAEEAEAKDSGAIPPLQALEAIESLEGLEALLAERKRNIKTRRQQRTIDDLIRRVFAEPAECNWDRKYKDAIVLLALRPTEVGLPFKLREWMHRPIHALYHRPR